MKEISWNSPYLNRRVWLLEHLDVLHVNAQEALVLLLIDLYNEMNINIEHEKIAQKLKVTEEEVESIFLSLSEKGYLNVEYKNGALIFSIGGVYGASVQPQSLNRSIMEEFEMGFKRTLSPVEMQRILDLSSTYDERRVICALYEAVAAEKRSIDYIERMLVRWTQKGLSIEDLENGIR